MYIYVGGVKRGKLLADTSKMRMSLKCSKEKMCMLIELAIFLQETKMRMRGQYYNSNPAVIQSGMGGVDQAQRVINMLVPDRLVTRPDYVRRFYGEHTHGQGQVIPPPLSLEMH